jgi:hypothetical protein
MKSEHSRLWLIGSFIKSWFKVTFKILWNVILLAYDLFNYLARWLGPVENSISGKINKTEFLRVIQLALAGGGGVYEAFHYIFNNVGSYVTDPVLAATIKGFVEYSQKHWYFLHIILIVFVLDFLRRMYAHGTTADYNSDTDTTTS